jgi:hypothetical protein
MPVRLPELLWPSELLEEGPLEDPSILLGGPAAIGKAPHRVVAVRIDPTTLAVDFRTDLDEDVYADCQVEDMLDELTFLEDIDQSVLVPLAGGSYVIWLMPFGDTGRD